MCMEYVKSVFYKKEDYTQDSLCEEAQEVFWCSFIKALAVRKHCLGLV